MNLPSRARHLFSGDGRECSNPRVGSGFPALSTHSFDRAEANLLINNRLYISIKFLLTFFLIKLKLKYIGIKTRQQPKTL